MAHASSDDTVQVVYGGDGNNDFEGAIRVPEGGVVLARQDHALPKRLEEASRAGQGCKGIVKLWKDQEDLGSAIEELLLE